MPVRRCADVDNVDILVGEKFHEVLVGLDLAPTVFLRSRKARLNAIDKRIAKADEPRALVRQVVLRMRNHTEADQRTGQLVGRSCRAPEDVRRYEVKGPNGRRTLQKGSS